MHEPARASLKQVVRDLSSDERCCSGSRTGGGPPGDQTHEDQTFEQSPAQPTDAPTGTPPDKRRSVVCAVRSARGWEYPTHALQIERKTADFLEGRLDFKDEWSVNTRAVGRVNCLIRGEESMSTRHHSSAAVPPTKPRGSSGAHTYAVGRMICATAVARRQDGPPMRNLPSRRWAGARLRVRCHIDQQRGDTSVRMPIG